MYSLYLPLAGKRIQTNNGAIISGGRLLLIHLKVLQFSLADRITENDREQINITAYLIAVLKVISNEEYD
jgi:hypothetical protein